MHKCLTKYAAARAAPDKPALNDLFDTKTSKFWATCVITPELHSIDLDNKVFKNV